MKPSLAFLDQLQEGLCCCWYYTMWRLHVMMTLRYHLRDTRIGPFPVPKELLDLLLTVLATAVIVILSPDPEQRCPIHGRCVPTRFPCVRAGINY